MGKSKVKKNGKPTKNGKAKPLPEVMTLSEAAEWLRVSEQELLDAAQNQTVPSLAIGSAVRFSQTAIKKLMEGSIVDQIPFGQIVKKSLGANSNGQPRTRDEKQRLLSVIGSMSDDETWEPMIDEIYRERARHIVGGVQ